MFSFVRTNAPLYSNKTSTCLLSTTRRRAFVTPPVPTSARLNTNFFKPDKGTGSLKSLPRKGKYDPNYGIFQADTPFVAINNLPSTTIPEDIEDLFVHAGLPFQGVKMAFDYDQWLRPTGRVTLRLTSVGAAKKFCYYFDCNRGTRVGESEILVRQVAPNHPTLCKPSLGLTRSHILETGKPRSHSFAGRTILIRYLRAEVTTETLVAALKRWEFQLSPGPQGQAVVKIEAPDPTKNLFLVYLRDQEAGDEVARRWDLRRLYGPELTEEPPSKTEIGTHSPSVSPQKSEDSTFSSNATGKEVQNPGEKDPLDVAAIPSNQDPVIDAPSASVPRVEILW